MAVLVSHTQLRFGGYKVCKGEKKEIKLEARAMTTGRQAAGIPTKRGLDVST